MKYGYFDDRNKEYIITKPNTPAPWANYLGDPNYGAIITNNAGGYSFEKSGANGRILRYVFNCFDEPGRYIYLRDNESKDYWSASWGPVHKDLKKYKTKCHHGLGYSTFKTDYNDIYSEATYYVPLNSLYEVWYLKVTNNSNIKKDLTLTGYAEFTNNNNYEQDQVNLQYSLFITTTEFKTNRIIQKCDGNLDIARPTNVTNRFFGLVNSKVSSYCGDKESFLGNYHHYDNPLGVSSGKLSNKVNYCMNSCGALSTKISLQPNETKCIAFILGMKNDKEAKKILDSYKDINKVEKELNDLKTHWSNALSSFKVKTPSKEFNSMINTWHSYNCFMTFIWSRAASLIYCGLRNGYGYRDTVQDIQGIIHLNPSMAKDKLTFMLSAQVNNGAGLPLVKFDHNAGHEDTPDDDSYVRATGHPAYRADDALWLFPTVYKYLSETGDLKYLDKVIPYANKDKATVYEHLKKALDFTNKHLGKHLMPAGLHADWNDCLRLGKKGESTFVAFQYYYALNITKTLATYKNDSKYIKYLDSKIKELKTVLNKCYKEGRFFRGYTEDGTIIGSPKDLEANMWLNPQSWSVISGLATTSQANSALDLVYKRLNTKFGAKLMDPPYHAHSFDGALSVTYNPGCKENASVFLQTQGWLILAESLLGHGDRAFEYYKESCPAYQNNIAEKRKIEPYCYGQFSESNDSKEYGRSQVHWLTGTASTVMVSCVEGILGIRPDLNGLRLVPAIPASWKKFEIEKEFRGSKLHIKVIRGKDKGLTINNKKLKSNYIPASILDSENKIILTI